MKVLDQFKEKRQTAIQNSMELTDTILARLKIYVEDVRKYVSLDQEDTTVTPFNAGAHIGDSAAHSKINTSPALFEAYQRIYNSCGFTYFIGSWFTIDQPLINQFSDVTFDNQWIHTDVKRASRSPFRSTIAQGFLTLSLIPHLTDDSKNYEQYLKARFVVNLGLNKTRFLQPVKAGARVRARKKILHAELLKQGIQITEEITIEIEHLNKPACIAETVVMLRL